MVYYKIEEEVMEMTAHIESEKKDIAKKVLLPGDPKRAKYIAEKFLENAVCINDVRGMLGYTGMYKGEKITVFATGMGMPSMGIYAYELCKFYDVDTLIRIGTCGANKENLHMKDIILATASYTLSSYPYLFFDDLEKIYFSNQELNEKIEQSAKEHHIPITKGLISTSDIFDVYVDKDRYLSKYPKDLDILAFEMEAAALFAIGKHLNRKSACLLTVVDSIYEDDVLTSEEREKTLDEMIVTALDAIVL